MEQNKQEQNFELIETDVDFEKRSIEDILKDAKTIDTKAASEELLQWIDNNIENFVDSQSKIYKLDLVIDDNTSIPMVKKLQDLYRAIPDETEEDANVIEEVSNDLDCSGCRRKLDKVTEAIYEEIAGAEERLHSLFNRLIYYYEKVIMNPDNKKMALVIDEDLKNLIKAKDAAMAQDTKDKIQEQITKKIGDGEELVKFEKMDGTLKVTKFEYDAFSVGVKIAAPDIGDSFKQDAEKKVVKQYTIPEGFTIWIELAYRLKQRPTTMF